MFNHPFAYVMVATFLAAIVALLSGIAGLGSGDKSRDKSTRLMTLRVGLCFLLLVEMLIYVAYFK